MSAEATSWAWSHAEKMENSGQLLILLALAEHSTPDGECFPNRRTIARMCGFSEKSLGNVTRHINKIESLGLIEKDERYDEKSSRRTSNVYRLKLEVKGATPSGAVATPPVAPSAGTPVAPSAGQEPSSKEPEKGTQQTSGVSPDVRKVYEHHLAVFKPQRAPKLGPSLIRQIEKGLREYDAADLCVAIDGLFEWRKTKPGKTTLGAIFDTYPGGKPLVEQIAFFISRAKGATGVGKGFPSADAAIVAEKQRLVQRGHRLRSNSEAVEQAKDAEHWLRQHGIETVRHGNGSVPTFRPLDVQPGAAAAGSGASA